LIGYREGDKLKIKTKLGIGLGVQLLFTALLGLTALFGILAVNRQFRFVVEHDDPVIENARHLSKLVVDMETGQRGFCITHREEFLEPYTTGINSFAVLIEEEKNLVSDNPSQFAALKRIENLVSQWKTKAAQPEIAMSRKVAKGAVDAGHLQTVLGQGVGKKLMDRIMSLGHEIEVAFSGKQDWEGAFAVEVIEKCMADREAGQRGFLITGKEEFLEKYVAGEQKKLSEWFHRLRTIVSKRGREDELSKKVDQLEQLTLEWTTKAADPEIDARRKMNKHPESLKDVAALLEAGTGKKLIDEIRKEFDKFIEIETKLAAERYNTAIETTTWTRNLTLGILIVAIFVGGCVLKILGQTITRPLAELAHGAKAIGSGDLGTQVEVRLPDEIGGLAGAFNSMSLNLKTMDSMRQQAESSLEQSNIQLEQRIEERTVKLKEANDRLMVEAESRHESEERVRLLLDSTVEGIFGLDLDGNCTFCNRACIETLGYNHADELLGQNMHDLVHHTRVDGSVQPLQESRIYGIFRAGEGIHVDDEVLWKADGNSFPAAYRSVPIYSDGEIVGLVVTFLDITDQRNIEVKLMTQQSELNHVARLSMLGEMAAGLAHELNQPLTAMSALAEGALLRLDRNNLNESEFVTVCQNIASDARRAGEIIRRLRSFVQKRKTVRSSVDLNHLIREVINFLDSETRQDDILIELKCCDDLLPVEADVVEIQQVIVNLIRNACDALTDETAQVEERRIIIEIIDRDDSFMEVIVSDLGPGIPEFLSERLFEPFLTTKAGGLGIGLGICKSIIEAHGGKIWTGPTGLGGARFHFELPIFRDLEKSEKR
jgi:PAS domain S-box-containing protein